jgi:cell shape-determining protein MreC
LKIQMTYLSGKAQKKRSYTRYALLTGVFLIICIFWPTVRKYSYGVLEPVVTHYGLTKQSLVVFPEFFGTYITSHKSLALENQNLRSENERLLNELAEKDASLREFVTPDVLSVATTTSHKMPLVLYPLTQDITKLYGTVILSKGYKDGVTVGDTVYIKGNQAACTIKEVSNSSSLCLLLTASGVVTEGVGCSSSVTLTLTGRGGHYLANIARDTPVITGEIVYLRSNPKVVLGKVQQVANNNQDTSWHVFVEGAYNPVTSSIFYVQPQ